MTNQSYNLLLALFAFILLSIPVTSTLAQNSPIVYPSQGQSQQQQAQDESQCRSWAQQQTGFNPYQARTHTDTSQPRGEIVGGAARGSILGVIGGAIAGDAGKGAAIGAGVGAAGGLMRRNRNRRSTNQAQQSDVARHNQGLQNFNRAFATCMQGRGYAVN